MAARKRKSRAYKSSSYKVKYRMNIKEKPRTMIVGASTPQGAAKYVQECLWIVSVKQHTPRRKAAHKRSR